MAGMILSPKLGERLSQISIPTLAYLCTRDPDFANVQAVHTAAAKFQQQIPHAEVVILDNLGHYPHREAPEQVVPKVIS